MYRYIGDTGILTSTVLFNFATVLVYLYNFLNFKYKKNFLSNCAKCYIRGYSHRKNKLFSKTNFWVFVEILVVSVTQYIFSSFLNNEFGDLQGTGANYFGILFGTPYILFALFYYISINPLKQMDLITPAFPLALVSVKIGCFCFGCCKGFECSWGLYFPSIDMTCFPTQLLEVAQAIIIFIFLQKYKNKAKDGTLFPIYLIIYSATRFFIEFTSYRDPVFGVFNEYHFTCFFGVIVGLVYLIIVRKFSEQIVALFDRGFIFENGRSKRVKKRKH